MRGHSEFEIPFTGLGIGRHAYGFQLDGTFFSEFEPEELVDAEIEASTELDRFDGMMHFDVHVKGTVRSTCDRCTGPITVTVDHRVRYVVKFGERTHRTDDDILVLGPAEHVLDVRELLFESTVLGMPLRRVHEREEECDPSVLQWLTGSADVAPDEVQEEADPRWAALRALSSAEDQERDEGNEEEKEDANNH